LLLLPLLENTLRADCDTNFVSLLSEKRLAPLPFTVVCWVEVEVVVVVVVVTEGVITFNESVC